MTARVTEFVSLSRTEQTLLCVSAGLLLASRLLLAATDVERTRRTLRRLAGALPPFGTVDDPDRIPWAVRCAKSHLPGSHTCLPQATVGEALLADNGYPATVRVGVSKRETDFEAHAWVLREGEVVLGDLDDLDRFQPLTDLDAAT